jgi:glycosyltransferase involved in cell wall biosynthesis
MKIAINGFFLSRPFTGFGDYTIGLLKGLSGLDSKNRYHIFTPESVSLKLKKNFHFRVIKPWDSLGGSFRKVWWEQWQIMRAAEEAGCQLVHHFYPVTSILIRSLPQITTIHDAIPWIFPEYNYSLATRALRNFIKWSARWSDLIVTVSQTSKQDIIKLLNIEPDKIKVIYNGYQKKFDKKMKPAEIAQILKRYQVQPPFIFYLGGFDIRKNVKRLILAFNRISRQTKADLVLAGGVFSPQRAIYRDYYQMPQTLKRLDLKDRVKLIGPVESKDLPAFYQAARLFVSPSMAEGFNIPVLEAFASGAPVACSHTSGTKELAQDNALTFNPKEVKEIARAMLDLLKDENLRKKYILRGRQHARDFSWKKSAGELLKIYRRFDRR